MAERDEELWMAQQEARFWREEARRIWVRAQALREYVEDQMDNAPFEVVEALELEPPGADLSGEVFREAVRRRVFQVLGELGVEV
jgi:hypothetical protein